jgi:hypothetical protein
MKKKDKKGGITQKVKLAFDDGSETSFVSKEQDANAIQEKGIVWITTEPRISPIPIKYNLTGTSQNGDIKYEAWVSYNDHGRNEYNGHRVDDPNHPNAPLRGSSPTLSFAVDFGKIVQGGTLNIVVTVHTINSNGETGTLTDTKTMDVRGTNPSKAEVKAELGDLELQVMAFLESNQTFEHFDNQKLPLFGPPHGFGIMQLDNPPPTVRELWDWKANIAAGRALFILKQEAVKQHFEEEQQKHPEAPPLTEEQMKLAFYQAYNGGYYWQWNNTDKKWEKYGNYPHADRCLKFEKLVKAGTPPDGWN